MDDFTLLASVVLIVISVVVVAVGVSIILLVLELRKSVRMLHKTLELAGSNMGNFVSSLQHIGAYTLSLKAGVKTLEGLVDWLRSRSEKSSKNRKKDSD